MAIAGGLGGLEAADLLLSAAFAKLDTSEITKSFAEVTNGYKSQLAGVEKSLKDLANPKIAAEMSAKFGVPVETIFKRLQADAADLKSKLDIKPPPTGIVGAFASISGGIDKVDESLKRAGLSFRGVSVLLGAGLAGGVTGVIRVLEKAISTITDFVSSERALAEQTQKTFGDAASEISHFVNTTAAEFGANRDEALKTANSFAELGRSIQLPREALGPFAETLTVVAAETFHAVGGFKNIEDAAKTLASAIDGDQKAFAKLGITLNEVAQVAESTFGKLPDQLTPAETQFVAIKVAIEAARREIDETGTASKSTAHAIADAFKEVAGGIDTSSKEFQKALKEIRGEGGGAGGSAGVEGLNQFSDAIEHLTIQELELLKIEAQRANRPDSQVAIDAINKEIEARKKRQAILDEDLVKLKQLFDVQELNREALERSSAEQQKALDLLDSLTQAQDALAKSQRRLQEIRQDSEREYQDLLRQNARALHDADQRIKDANLELQHAAEDRNRVIKESNENLQDAIIEAGRSVRNAQEKVGDEEREHTRKIEDLQQRIADAHKKSAKDTIDAQIAIETALLHGDEAAFNAAERDLARARRTQDTSADLANAEKELAREREDHALKHSRLLRDESEAERDAARKIQKAHEEQDKAIENADRQLARAQEALDKARIDRQRVIEDNDKRLTEFEIKRSRALIEANEVIEKNVIALDKANRKALEYAKSIGVADVEALKKLINEIILFNELGGVPGQPQVSIIGSGGFPLFAAGGPIEAGEAGIIGERGPELFIPRSSGTIISNSDLIAALEKLFTKQSNQQGGHNFTIIDNTGQADAIAEAVLARAVRGIG